MDIISKKLKYTLLYNLIFPVFQILQTTNWYLKDKNTYTPHLIKQRIIKEYGKKYGSRIFIETGTYLGMMVNAMKKIFPTIYTIELDNKLYKNAKRKFANQRHIKVIKGDSSKILPNLLKNINKPALFWLDAHYSKGVTAKGSKNTPIAEELNSILNQERNHVILVDDAEVFNGNNDYPSLNYLKKYIAKHYPQLIFEVKYNIIRITPKHLNQRGDKTHA